MNIRKYINNIAGPQIFQVLRFITFTILSIFFTKGKLSSKDIGDYELFLFIASAVSYFWVTGIIQTMLPLYSSNKIFRHSTSKNTRKSPEIFNAFLLITLFSLLIVILGLFVRKSIFVYNTVQPLPYANLLLVYILLSNPVCLIEYIYLLRNRSLEILYYGFITFSLQLLFVIFPVAAGYGVKYALYGLIAISALRAIWLTVMLIRYAEFTLSWEYLKTHIRLGMPLIISTLLSGSAQYIDGIFVSSRFSPEEFAKFRYGAKEMPLVVMLASGLNNAMLPEFTSPLKIKKTLESIKRKSLRLMHFLYPISIFLMVFANRIFPAIFNPSFIRSADVFMVYILLITSRLLFPQTILIGMKKTRVVMGASIMNMIINIGLTILFLSVPRYGIVGVAVATVIVFFIEKAILIAYNYFKLKIKPTEYIPVMAYIIYSSIIVILFVLIDHRIIMIPSGN